MKLVRILLASVALLSVAACSSDRITGPASTQGPAASGSGPARPTLSPADTTNVSYSTTTTCSNSYVMVNGVLTEVTCDSGQFGSGQ